MKKAGFKPMKKHPLLISGLIASIVPIVSLVLFLIFLNNPTGWYYGEIILLVLIILFGLNSIFCVWLFRLLNNKRMTLTEGIQAGVFSGLTSGTLLLVIGIIMDSSDFISLIILLLIFTIIGLVGGVIGGLIFQTGKVRSTTRNI